MRVQEHKVKGWSVADYIDSAGVLAGNKRTQKEIKQSFEIPKQEAHAAHRAITTAEKEELSPLVEKEKDLKEKMIEWRNATLQYEIDNRHEGVSIVPDIPGIKFREYWHFELADAADVPREFLMLDEKKIKEFARSTRGNIEVAGINFIKKTEIASS